MEDIKSFFKNIYQYFNERNIELVIDNMTDDVQWANGMEGGYLHGRDAVREYWIRQFGLINSKVVPLQVEGDRDVVKIKVHQVVHDLNGNLLADEITEHYFYLRNGSITRFDIGDKLTG
jgi:hypothetical protein